VQNIEIKCPLLDRPGVERRLAELGAGHCWVRAQKDTFFPARRGWLKLREEESADPQLIAYERSTASGEPRISDYEIVFLENPAQWLAVLERALGVEQVVEKQRSLWRYRHTRVHLDHVVGLGEFLELETVVQGISAEEAMQEASSLVDGLGLDRRRFLSVPYRTLLQERAPARRRLPGAPRGPGSR